MSTVAVIFSLLASTSNQCELVVFHWSLNKSKSSQVSRTLCIILADVNAVVWIVSIRPLIFSSSSPLSNSLRTIPRMSVIIGITVTFMFHNFHSSIIINIIIIMIIILIFWEFFIPVLSKIFPFESRVTASLLKSPLLFSVFWPISTVM